MEQTIEERLVEIYKERDTRKGKFTKIIEHYSELILEYHGKGKKISYIKTVIANKLNYDFGFTDAICPFHRAIFAYIKKQTIIVDTIPSVPLEKTREIPVSVSQKKDISEEEEEETDLGVELTNTKEADDLFKIKKIITK
jgi:hypothetical protein